MSQGTDSVATDHPAAPATEILGEDMWSEIKELMRADTRLGAKKAKEAELNRQLFHRVCQTFARLAFRGFHPEDARDEKCLAGLRRCRHAHLYAVRQLEPSDRCAALRQLEVALHNSVEDLRAAVGGVGGGVSGANATKAAKKVSKCLLLAAREWHLAVNQPFPAELEAKLSTAAAADLTLTSADCGVLFSGANGSRGLFEATSGSRDTRTGDSNAAVEPSSAVVTKAGTSSDDDGLLPYPVRIAMQLNLVKAETAAKSKNEKKRMFKAIILADGWDNIFLPKKPQPLSEQMLADLELCEEYGRRMSWSVADEEKEWAQKQSDRLAELVRQFDRPDAEDISAARAEFKEITSVVTRLWNHVVRRRGDLPTT